MAVTMIQQYKNWRWDVQTN